MTKEYYQKHKERILLLRKKNYELKKKEKIAYVKKYAEEHREKVRQYKKKWADNNRELQRKLVRESKQKNRKYYRDKARQRRHTDIEYRITCNLRKRVWDALHGVGTKADRTLSLLGCSIPELKDYLAKKFTTGMSWNNYGKWHIDHVKPCAEFDLTKESEQRTCFHFTNLQPLWAHDNLVKNATYAHCPR